MEQEDWISSSKKPYLL